MQTERGPFQVNGYSYETPVGGGPVTVMGSPARRVDDGVAPLPRQERVALAQWAIEHSCDSDILDAARAIILAALKNG